MSKKKGVSAAEKQERMLQLFYETKEFFQLKDLEKIAPKEKGITANSVKDVVQKLVDDGLVDTDKIGTSIYFWAFPSKKTNNLKRKLNELQENYQQAKKKLKQTNEAIANWKNSDEDKVEINKILDSITDLEIERDELQMKLKKYHDNDPTVLEAKRKQIQSVKEAANRWTDNIFAIKTWCKNKFNIEEEILNKRFGVPADFDYIG